MNEKFQGKPDNIKNIRIIAMLSQAQMAKLIGVTASAVSKFERGDLAPSIYTAKKIMSISHHHGLSYTIHDIKDW